MNGKWWLLVLGVALVGCDEGEDDPDGGAVEDAGEGNDPAAFIVGSTLNSVDGFDAYVAVLSALEEQEIDYDEALEITGRADVWVWDDKVFIGQAEAPEVQQYELSDAGKLRPAGEPLSFAKTGLSGGQFWNAIWLSPTKAYMNVIAREEYQIWNPREMVLEGTVPHPEIEQREGYVLRNSSTNRGSVVRDGKLYHTFYWTSEDYDKYAPDSRIAVYDVKTDELLDVIEAPCPGLDVASQDDEGNLYFSSWTGLAGLTLVLDEPEACAVKVPAGSDEIDEDWTIAWPDITDGRQAAALRVQGDGMALVSVFHDERVDYDEDSDAFEIIGTENWETWRVDLEARTAKPLKGIEPNSGAIYVERIGDLAYALVPTKDYQSSVIYEVDGAKTKPLFETRGWCTRLFQLR